MRHGIIPKNIVIIPLLILQGFLFFSCSGARTTTEFVRFAVLGNTSPESPFSGFTKSFPDILNEIESHKPQIIIHTGDAFYGGSAADGILESDLRRQMKIFFPALKKLRTAVYTIPGDKDYYDGNLALYSEYSRKKDAYSFNYGSIHFICLYSSSDNDLIIDKNQNEWLKKDLNEFRDSSAVFVFMHHQMFPNSKRNPQLDNNEMLHSLFVKYNIKAVFSGSDKAFSTKLKDSVEYINAGCISSKDKKDRRSNRFYIINFVKNRLDIEAIQ